MIVDHGPLDAGAIASRVGLHLNTVRAHLASLAEAELVESDRMPGAGRGRPRLAYRSTGADRIELRRYRLLAEILTALVARGAPGNRPEIEAIGELWGRHLVESPPPLAALGEDEALERLVGLLEESGFGPRTERDDGSIRLLMKPCPFLELARRHPDVVCPIHLGVMRGALAELGGALEATRLVPFQEADLCVAHLERRTAPRETVRERSA